MTEARRRAVRIALRLGVIMLAGGAQAQEAEESLRKVMRAFGLQGGDAIVTSSSVTVSYVAPGDAEATTAIQAVRDWGHDFSHLAAAGTLAHDIRKGRIGIPDAEAELDRIDALASPYPAWLRFAAPALLAGAVTIMFGGSVLDMLATLGIGLAIQPAQSLIERSTLPLFFQTVFGVSATALLVVALASFRSPIDSSLVLTGGLLRFLPGGQLVAGTRDLIARTIVSGAANLAEVFLLGIAIAGAASLVIAIGRGLFGVDLVISAEGRSNWPAFVTVLAGAAAVAASCIRLGVPRRQILSTTLLGAVTVIIAEGFTPLSASFDHHARILSAALVIGVAGRFLALKLEAPPALWLVPAILPLLPAPATLLPLLAENEAAQQALREQALTTAFLIGVGVASGDILLSAWQRRRMRGVTD